MTGSIDKVRAVRGRRAELAGRAAEDIAIRHYVERGGTVVAHRWRRREGELDLVVEIDRTLVFVEVKSGQHARYAIGARQWARLEAAATRYIAEHQTGDTDMRFDAFLVDRNGAVEVIENARIH